MWCEKRMPNITVIREDLFQSIGKTFTDEEFDEVCFSFGVEIDDICTETIEVFHPTVTSSTLKSFQFTGDGSKRECVVYVIAIPANRHDLLCIEGFARAIRIFLRLADPPVCCSPFLFRFFNGIVVEIPLGGASRRSSDTKSDRTCSHCETLCRRRNIAWS